MSELLEGELPNGIDDNGNGLIDEPGFSIDFEGRAVNVRLSLERRGATGRNILRTAETRVRLRN